MPAALVTLSLLGGCAEPPRTLVGDLLETDARVGISVADGIAIAYVAGGTQTLASHSRWFEDELFGPELDAESAGWTLSASVSEAAITGWLTSPEGERWELVAEEEGLLLESEDAGCRDGAVLGPEGEGLDFQGVWCDERGSLAPISPAAELDLELEVLPVQVRSDAGLRSFEMRRAAP